MRKQLLGATVALVSAGAVSVGLPVGPSQGASWVSSMNEIPFPAGVPTQVEVVSTGPGDAVAVAVIDDDIHAYTAIDGDWTGHALVRADVQAVRLVVSTNAQGDVVAAWRELLNGNLRVRASRQLNPTTWTGAQILTPAGTNVVGNVDIGIAGDGLVIATATVDEGDVKSKLLVTEWQKGQAPSPSKVLAPSRADAPVLDVNTEGEALIAYNYRGLPDDQLTVVRRTPGQGWSAGDTTDNASPVIAVPDVAISDNGQGQVIYSVEMNGSYVAHTSRVLPDGTAMADDPVGPTDDLVQAVQVDMNATGSALFSWVSMNAAAADVRYATAANQSYPGNASTLAADVPKTLSALRSRVSDDGLRVVQYVLDTQLVTHTQAGSVQPFVSEASAAGFLPDAAVDVDGEGNAVVVGAKSAGGIYGRFFDAAGPTVTADPLPVNMLVNPTQPGTTFPITWDMADSLSDIPHSDVLATSAAWNETTHSASEVVVNNVAGTQAEVPWTPGTSYCLQVRSTDAAKNVTTTAAQCTTVPLDDPALVGEGWNDVADTGSFRDTLTTTTKQGRVLTRTGVKAKRLALLVRKTATGGTVKVNFAGEVLGSYSLVGAGKKQVIQLATFPVVESGTLTITVTSPDGKLVSIDGLVVAK